MLATLSETANPACQSNMAWQCHRGLLQVWDLCSYVHFFALGAYMVKRVCLQTAQHLLTNFKDHPHLGSRI